MSEVMNKLRLGQEIRLLIDVVIDARDKVYAMRESGAISWEIAEPMLDEMNAKLDDLFYEEERRNALTTVAVAPTQEQVETLRAKVNEMRNRNVAAAALGGLVAEALALASQISSAPAAARTRSAEPAASIVQPRSAMALLGAAAVGAVFTFAVLGSRGNKA